MADTPNFQLSEISTGQAQKEVTHNENMFEIDGLTTGAEDLANSPGITTNGTVYMVDSAGTGDFSGQDNKLAIRIAGAWKFKTPKEGLIYLNKAANRIYKRGSTNWEEITVTINIVEDSTPQLGAMLDANTFGIGDGTDLILDFVEDTGTPVNYIEIENEATGSGPIIRAVGADTNVDLNLDTKGTGDINFNGVKTNAFTDSDETKLDGIATGAEVNDGQDLGEFTVAGLPTASSNANAYALANDASGGRTIVRSDGTDWKVVVVEGATVTV